MDNIMHDSGSEWESIVWPKRMSQVPKEVFTNRELFERELKMIFYGNCWHPVAHAAEIPNPGDFKTFYLGRMPLLITRGKDGKIRSFFNSCAHRGAQVEMSTCGNRTEFECPYHRWVFDTQGKLVGCPGQKEFSPEFNMANFGLRPIRTEEFMGLVHVTMGDNPPPLLDWMGPSLRWGLETALVGGKLKLMGYQKVRYTSNWKAYNDNDGYHAPLLHSAFRLLNWQGGAGKQEISENGHTVITGELKPATGGGFLRDTSLIDYKEGNFAIGSCAIQIFPITVIVKHMDTINVRFAIPRSHDDTEVHYAYFSVTGDDEAMQRHRLRQASNLLGPAGVVSMEDAAIFERIHTGTNSPGYAEFQKGVVAGGGIGPSIKQNDESGLIRKWEYYRELMGFHREV